MAEDPFLSRWEDNNGTECQNQYMPAGRPSATSARELELVALDLFASQGFAQTSVEQIAVGAGVSKRTFFRYFESKSAVLWHDFDNEVDSLRDAFSRIPAKTPLMTAIHEVVLSVNRYRAEDVPELRTRMGLIGSDRDLQASAALHYDAWERTVAEFAAARLDQPAESLQPMAIGRTTLAACRAAYDVWLARADANLTTYLDEALHALSSGFRTPSK
jgi:mycofactocin system transcriptional regulator